MSQTSKHIEWCLKKGEKEIGECKKSGRRLKHRGLLKTKPDIENSKKHLLKAKHNFDAITKFREIGFSDWSITAGFYCIYHCFLAITSKFGYESKNQECTISLIKNLKEENKINIDGKFIDMLKHEEIKEIHEGGIIEMRENYTYGVDVSVEDKSKIDDLVKNCKEIIDITKEIIFK